MGMEPESTEVTNEFGVGIPNWLPVDLSYRLTITKRWRKRGEHFADAVQEFSGLDADAVGRRLEADEVLGDATFAAGEKALRAADAEFRLALARLVAAGLIDDARVDATGYYVSVLTQLEPVHLRLLGAFGNLHKADATYNSQEVGRAVGVPPDVADSAAARLHALALLTDRIPSGDVVKWPEGGATYFHITSSGRALLNQCLSLYEPPHTP